MAKKSGGKKQKITVTGSVIKIEYPTIRKSLQADVSTYDEAVKFAGLMHGFKQQYGDAESGGTPAEKYEMVQRLMEAHKSGSWTLTSRAFDGGIIIEAAARCSDKTVEQIRAEVEAAGEEGIEMIRKWRSHPKIQVAIAKIRLERAEAAAADAEDFEAK